MDDVAGVSLAQLRSEGTRESKSAGDAPLALMALPGYLDEQGGRSLVGSRRVRKNAMDRCRAAHQPPEHGCEPGQLVPRISVREKGADLRAVQHGNGPVVTGDRSIEDAFEDPELRGEEPVHRRLRRARGLADRLDRGSCIPAL